MNLYKGIAIDPALNGLIRHMHGIDEYREVLGRLQSGWDTLALLGELSHGAAEMADTREAFERLTGDLLSQLGVETLKKSLSGLRTKAQNSIDILVRNLFERTADIGFLAADTDIRDFLESGADDSARATLEARFREYVAKYSVYSDIVLMTPDGRICARLDSHAAQQTQHPLLREALTSAGAYVEFFGEADFLPAGRHLVYAWRVAGRGGRPVGALALVFRLRDEFDGVFRHLLSDGDWTILASVGADNRVIASSCAVQMPEGLSLPANVARANGEIARIGGRQYLAVACRSAGYQGYLGPGWTGLALVPIEHAFDEDAGAGVTIEAQALEDILRESALFPDSLRAVPRQAAQIQRNLSRSVWNGSVRLAGAAESDADFSKALLRETSNAGAKTQAIFDQAIANLQQTVIAALLQNVQARAAFAIDVMDRNLYERANDCRWWALDATFRRALAGSPRDEAKACASVLATINGLYTVYTNLILFDAEGVIVAVSQPSEAHRVGEKLAADWVARTLSSRTTQDYAVSSFEPSALYGDRATYVYAAAVQHPTAQRRVGGIAIVFDAEPQFAAMLDDALPRDAQGERIHGSVALFLDRDGRVIASTDAAWPVGSIASLGFDIARLRNGEGASAIIARDGKRWAIGAVMSAGYREYKRTDGYACDIVSVCAAPLCAVSEESATQQLSLTRAVAARPRRAGVETIEVATFRVSDHWLGVPASDVIEAIAAGGLATAGQVGEGPLLGYKLHRGAPIAVLQLARAIGAVSHGAGAGEQQIVVAKTPEGTVGFLVDDLGDIPQIARSEIAPLTWRCDAPALGVVARQDRNGDPAGLLLILDLARFGEAITAPPPMLQAAE